MVAIRYDPGTAYLAGNGKTAEVSQTTSSATYLEIDNVLAGEYLLTLLRRAEAIGARRLGLSASGALL